MKTKATLTVLFCTMLTLVACTSPAVAPTTTDESSATPVVQQPTAEPSAGPTTEVEIGLPVALKYNLGETTIAQSRFPEDSRFHDMPVRLNGIIAVPTSEDGPYPSRPHYSWHSSGCPNDEGGVDRWPCDPDVEQPNYQGFAYLVEALAAEGLCGDWRPTSMPKTPSASAKARPANGCPNWLSCTLGALAEAAAGGPNDFGVELGRPGRHEPPGFLRPLSGWRGGQLADEQPGSGHAGCRGNLWLRTGRRAAAAGSGADLHPARRFPRAPGRDSSGLRWGCDEPGRAAFL